VPVIQRSRQQQLGKFLAQSFTSAKHLHLLDVSYWSSSPKKFQNYGQDDIRARGISEAAAEDRFKNVEGQDLIGFRSWRLGLGRQTTGTAVLDAFNGGH